MNGIRATGRSVAAASRRCLTALLAALALAAAAPGAAGAQITPSDSAAVLLDAADDFERRGERDVALAILRHVAQRYPETPAGRAALARLGGMPGAGVPAAGSGDAFAEPRGDTELMVFSTLYGLWLGGAVPAALEARGPETYGLGMLLGGPGGYFAGRAFAGSRPLSLGQARAIAWGGVWGAWQGHGWARVVDLGRVRGEERESERAVLVAMIAGSVVGTVGGVFASRREIRSGPTMAAALGSGWGAWFGAASAVLLDLREDPALATIMVTGNVGLVGGALVGSRLSVSRRRARLVSLSGLVGGVGGAGLALILMPGERHGIALPLAGSIAGLALGARWIGDDVADGAAMEDAAAGRPASGVSTAVAATGALLNRVGGSWSLSAPAPSPLWVPSPRGSGGTWAWKVPLLEIRF